MGEPVPDDVRRLIDEPLGTSQIRDVELTVGSTIYQVTVAPVPPHHYANLYCFDLTERKRAEERAKRAQEELRRALEFDEAVMAGMGEGLYTVDSQGQVTTMNPAAERLMGWSFGELRGRKMHDMTHYQHRDGTPFPADQCGGHQVLTQGKFLAAQEDVFIRKDGTFFDVVYSCSPIREKDRITGLVVVFRDVSEQNRVRAELRERETLLSTITNESRIGLVMVDRERRYLFANAAYSAILGLPSADIVGRRVADILAPVYDQISPRLDQAFSGQRLAYELSLPPLSASEGERHYEVTYEPRATGTDGAYVVVAVVDITARKRVEGELRKAHELLADRAKHLEAVVEQRTEKLQETIHELEAFSYSVSHDLRAPLRAMKSFSDILKEDAGPQLDPTSRDYLRRISAAAERMDQLIRDVLHYSQVVRAEFPLGRVDVEKLLRGIIESYPHLREPHAKIELEGEFPEVIGNEAALTQCLSNLLGNAVKFVAPGVMPSVRVWAETRGDRVVLRIRDNGIGIAREYQDSIFGIFKRLHKEYEGTGIGLTIVKKAAERMNGAISVESEPGKGSTFSLALPRGGAGTP